MFLEEGELLAVDGGKNKELHYFLFNDYLILTVKNTGLVSSVSSLVGANPYATFPSLVAGLRPDQWQKSQSMEGC